MASSATNLETNTHYKKSPDGQTVYKEVVTNDGALKTYKKVNGAWVEVSSINNT